MVIVTLAVVPEMKYFAICDGELFGMGFNEVAVDVEIHGPVFIEDDSEFMAAFVGAALSL